MPRVIAFGAVIVVCARALAIMQCTDTGKAIRAVAKEKLGAELVGIDVAHIYAVTFGLGTACLGDRRLPADPDLLRQSGRREMPSC